MAVSEETRARFATPGAYGGPQQAMARRLAAKRRSASPFGGGAVDPAQMPGGRPMAPALGTKPMPTGLGAAAPVKPMPTGLGAAAPASPAFDTVTAPTPVGMGPTGARPMAPAPNLGAMAPAAPARGSLQSLVAAGQGGMTQGTLNAQQQGVKPGQTLQQMIEMQRQKVAGPRRW